MSVSSAAPSALTGLLGSCCTVLPLGGPSPESTGFTHAFLASFHSLLPVLVEGISGF